MTRTKTSLQPGIQFARSAYGNSERQFGLVMAACLLALAIWPLFFDRSLHVWIAFAALVLAAVAWLAPSLLVYPTRFWLALGVLLHRVTNPLLLGAIYFVVITPIGLLMRAMRRDFLANAKQRKNSDSYWVRRDSPRVSRESFWDQF